jgi:FkbM family methyltransferase
VSAVRKGRPPRSSEQLKSAVKSAVQGFLRLPGALALAEAATRQLGRRWPDTELAIAPRFQIVESLLARGRDTTRRTGLPGGAELLVDLADYWGRKVYFCNSDRLDRGWVYESETTRFISRWLRPGDTFIDIGANVGFFAVLAASIVGPSGRVHAFEPNPVAHDLLARSAAANDLNGRLIVNRLAVTALTGSARLWRRPDLRAGDDASTIRRRGWIPIEVNATTIDDYCHANGIERARLVKIDVEGAELDVVGGAAHLLGAIRPDAVVCEFAPVLLAEPATWWARLLELFSRFGYSTHELDGSGAPQERGPEAPAWDWGNVCFVASERTTLTAAPDGKGAG